jgi:hypothetical protein
VIRGGDGIDATIAGNELEELVRGEGLADAGRSRLDASAAEELVDVVTWLETLRGQR